MVMEDIIYVIYKMQGPNRYNQYYLFPVTSESNSHIITYPHYTAYNFGNVIISDKATIILIGMF